MGSCAKICEEGLPNIGGNAQIFSPYMRRSLVIYDFAPDPSEFPNIWEHFLFFFIIVGSFKLEAKLVEMRRSCIINGRL
jgi:hypothetical protein